MTSPSRSASPRHAPFAPSTLPILMYHGVDEGFQGRLASLDVSSTRLTEQLSALRTAGYLLTGVSEALEALDGGDPRPRVALTFDDAYLSFADVVMPVLASIGARATVYVPVAHIGARAAWLREADAPDTCVMSWAALSEVAQSGAEIGSHGWAHNPMDVLDSQTAKEMLTRSRRELIDRLQAPVRSFCYPHGYSSSSLRAQVRLSDYENAVAIRHRVYSLHSDRFRMDRLMVRPHTSPLGLVSAVARLGVGVGPQLKSRLEMPWRVTRRVSRSLPMRELT